MDQHIHGEDVRVIRREREALVNEARDNITADPTKPQLFYLRK